MPVYPHDLQYHRVKGKRAFTKGLTVVDVDLGEGPKPSLDEALYHLNNIRTYVRGLEWEEKETVASALLDVMQIVKEVADSGSP